MADAILDGWTYARIIQLLDQASEFTPIYEYIGGKEKIPLGIYTYDGDDWPEPDMLVLNLDPPTPIFPIEMLGSFWESWITSKAKGASAPIDYVAATVLAASSTLIGNNRRISPWDGWDEPAFLWLALVGNPSSGKSPAMDPVLGLLREIELGKSESFEILMQNYEADCFIAQIAHDDWKHEVKIAKKRKHRRLLCQIWQKNQNAPSCRACVYPILHQRL